MNQRAFEAAACGAMLFMEEENLEVRDFFVPGKECVLFNDRNFEELLDHYLTHDDERAEIARKGYERAQAYSMPVLFGALMDKIQGMRLFPGQGRGRRRMYASMPQHRDFVQASLAKSGRGESTVKNVPILISDPSVDGLVLNDCAVILMSYADDLKTLGDPSDQEKIAAQALSLLTHAESRTPGYLTPVFNRAQILLASGKTQEASDIFRRLFTSDVPDSYEQCKGLAYPLHYGYPLRYEWSMALTAALPDSAAMARNRHTLIRFLSAVNLGTIARDREVPLDDEAIHWFEEAHSLAPDSPHAAMPLARLYLKKKNHVRTRELCRTALLLEPFRVDFWKEWALYLSDTNCINEARDFVESCLLCLGRLQLATKEMIEWFEAMRRKLTSAPS
jgi:tetratricopeptide (TPR) repeat protein